MQNTNRSRGRVNYSFSLVTAVVLTVCGFICTLPFGFIMMFGEHENGMSLIKLGALMLNMVGFPMFMFGLIAFFSKKNSASDPIAGEVSRIRYVAETQAMSDSMKGRKQ